MFTLGLKETCGDDVTSFAMAVEGISKECGKGGELNTSCLKLAVRTAGNAITCRMRPDTAKNR
jgi:hypothetical protein